MPTPDDFNEIEAMLGGLPVREPSQMLDARVASTLDKQTRSTLPWLATAAAVLIAASVTLVILFNPAPPAPDTDTPVADGSDTQPDDAPGNTPPILTVGNPTEALNLTWTRDIAEETRYTPTGEPYRAVVREAVHHRAWVDTKTGETSQIHVPHEELIVVKQSTF
ncbi:MAG: hypothetical protein KTR15_03420 [Phycisphaeraceae bacterium]|nr:hypothetical protein [Phycisphaeraceae bacterium]